MEPKQLRQTLALLGLLVAAFACLVHQSGVGGHAAQVDPRGGDLRRGSPERIRAHRPAALGSGLGGARGLGGLRRDYPGVTDILETWFADRRGPGEIELSGWADVDEVY